MKNRPILFSARMIRAILAGHKTQTRRIVRHPDKPVCPYGQAGDRLWVRETWGAADIFYQGHDIDPPRIVAYRADLSALDHISSTPTAVPSADSGQWTWDRIRWRPSIHMPRWASRITLAVKSVRVERLQAITTDDARAEGMPNVLSAVDDFAALWDEINGKRAAWMTNPLVWVIEFYLGK